MKHIYAWMFVALIFLALMVGTMAQTPVKATLAYSRSTTPGAPSNQVESSQNPFPTIYLVYVVVDKGAPISAIGVCVQQKRYEATLKKVDSPVVAEHDPNVRSDQKDVLVEKTTDDVYQVELQEGKSPAGTDCAVDKLARENPVVVYLKSGHSTCYGVAKKIVQLRPVAAM
jgi:hypothetical protein